jgi:hypothetical protein
MPVGPKVRVFWFRVDQAGTIHRDTDTFVRAVAAHIGAVQHGTPGSVQLGHDHIFTGIAAAGAA